MTCCAADVRSFSKMNAVYLEKSTTTTHTTKFRIYYFGFSNFVNLFSKIPRTNDHTIISDTLIYFLMTTQSQSYFWAPSHFPKAPLLRKRSVMCDGRFQQTIQLPASCFLLLNGAIFELTKK